MCLTTSTAPRRACSSAHTRALHATNSSDGGALDDDDDNDATALARNRMIVAMAIGLPRFTLWAVFRFGQALKNGSARTDLKYHTIEQNRTMLGFIVVCLLWTCPRNVKPDPLLRNRMWMAKAPLQLCCRDKPTHCAHHKEKHSTTKPSVTALHSVYGHLICELGPAMVQYGFGPCCSQNASGSLGANFSARPAGAHSAKGGSGTSVG